MPLFLFQKSFFPVTDKVKTVPRLLQKLSSNSHLISTVFGIRSTCTELDTKSVLALSLLFLEYQSAGQIIFFFLNLKLNLLMNCYQSDLQSKKRYRQELKYCKSVWNQTYICQLPTSYLGSRLAKPESRYLSNYCNQEKTIARIININKLYLILYIIAT